MRGPFSDPNFFAQLLDEHPDPIFVKNSESIFVYVNTALCEFVNVPAERILGKDDHGFLPPEYAEEHLANDRKVLASSIPVEREEIFEHDEEPIFVLVKKRALQGPDGKTYILGSLRDVTSYRKEQKVLLESQRVANIGSFENNLRTGRTVWSAQMYLIYGIQPFSILPTLDYFIQELVVPEDRLRLQETVRILFERASTEAPPPGMNVDYRIRRADNAEIRWITAHVEAVITRSGAQKLIGTAYDVTDVKVAEAKREEAERALAEQQQFLLQASKHTTLGELASGIGHEINTPLSAMLIKLEHIALLLARSPAQVEKAASLCRDTAGLVQKVADIVEGLKELSRSGSDSLRLENTEAFAPTAPIAQAVSLVRSRFSNHGVYLDIDDRCGPDTWMRGSRTYVFQVLVNLLNNAFDALTERGPKPGHPPWVRISVVESAEHIELRVSDSGPGVPPAIRDRLFMPFATTKTSGKGLGLGLNISQRLMRLQQGDLVLDPEAALTTFLVKVPKAGS